jgi:hypothetical protein
MSFSMVEKTKIHIFIVGFLDYQILNNVGFQIEKETIFFLVDILSNLKRCHVQIFNLKRLIFMNKNWPIQEVVANHLLIWWS